MNSKDVRWKQRYQNFERAFLLLKKYLSLESFSEIEKAGIIQFYEMSFELAWKLMKDYLQAEGFEINSPRDAIKQAFQSKLIEDGELWILALNDRNLTVHTYDENTANEVVESIRTKYFILLENLYKIFQVKL